MTKKRDGASGDPDHRDEDAAQRRGETDAPEHEQRRDAEGATDEPIAGGEADLATERDRLQVQLARAMADLQNIRKRHAKEMEEARARALEGFAAELLPVLDNFHLALEAHEQHEVSSGTKSETHAMVEGLRMVRSLLHGVLERHGLAEIPALGEPFDPNVHEAVAVTSDTGDRAGLVAQVMQRGYALGERIIRPAKVVVTGESPDRHDVDDRGQADSTE